MIGKLIRRTFRKAAWLPALGWYWRNWRQFRRMSRDHQRFGPIRLSDAYPCLDDRTSITPFDRHYLYHPAWAARVLARLQPPYHVDVSSTLPFSAIVSAFVPVRFYDYRPADVRLKNLQTAPGDLTKLPFESNSVPSISCMHTIEHIGLGRYGDMVDPEGDLKAMHELGRVVAPGGSLLLVTPVGKPVIRFNAHRVYTMEMILREFPDFKLELFTLISNIQDDCLIDHATPERVAHETYGCGCFWLIKKQPEAGTQTPKS